MAMQESGLGRFEKSLKLLAKRCGKKIEDDEVIHYFVHLQKYHPDTVCFVIDYWTHNIGHKKFPSDGELIKAVRGQSTEVYAIEKKVDNDREKRKHSLEDEYTSICKQICANQSNSHFMNHPIMRKFMTKNSEMVNQVNKDYSTYKTDLSTDKLYDKLREISKKISDLRMEI